MQFTAQTKIDDAHAEFLNRTAGYTGNLRVKLLNDLLDNKPINDLKKQYIAEYNLNARQFNSLSSEVRGIIQSAGALKKAQIGDLKDKTASLKKKIRSLEKELKKTLPACGIKGSKSPRRKLRFSIHQKKRKLAGLAARLEKLENKKRISVCSGTKKLFLAQFSSEENGFQNHDEWLKEWQNNRHNRIFYIGSKDETCGNQNCQLTGSGSLRIRVIPGLEPAYGQYYSITGISFAYGQEVVSEALKNHQAVNFRFVCKDKGWYLFLTTEKKAAEIITKKETGAVGVDLNAGHIAWAEVNRHGNLTDYGTISTPVQDRSSEQTEAMFSDALTQITDHAKKTGKPVVIENLDFSEKKKKLSSQTKYNRMITGFAYSLFFTLLLSKASREGVQVIIRNPAYSSVIGRYKFMQMYGISVHVAASLVLARRGIRFSERPPASYARYLAEHKYRHVWSFWSRFKKAVSDRKIQVNIFSSVRKKCFGFMSCGA